MSNVEEIKSRRRALPISPARAVLAKTSMGWDPPDNWTEICADLEKVGKVNLLPRAQAFLWEVLSLYQHVANVRAAEPKLATQRKTIVAVSKSVGKLREDLSGAVSVLTKQAELVQLLLDLDVALLRAGTVCDQAADALKTAGHRPPYPGFDQFVRRMATIYYFSKGNPSAAAAADPNYNTPFVRFCEAAHRLVPLNDAVPAPVRLKDSIRNELRRGDERYDDPFVQRIADALSG